jgi:SlyX protein
LDVRPRSGENYPYLPQYTAFFVSNSGMHADHATDQRLTNLEIKASFTEDLLDQLNLVIVRQQSEIAALVREVILLRQQALERTSSMASHASDDLPPHY